MRASASCAVAMTGMLAGVLATAAIAAESVPVLEPMPSAFAAALPARDMRRDELEIFVDGVMAAQFASHRLAGAAIVVVREGAILFEKGYGFSDIDARQRVDPVDTRFTVGSISKLIVWTAVMQLVERGQLDLDSDVNRYLVRFKVPQTFSTPITLRNLLTHTAGFEDVGTPFAPDIFRTSPSLGDFLAEHLPARAMPPARDFMHAALPYSNWGALLAAHIVECVSGLPFHDYASQHIFEPLGMRNSHFGRRARDGQQALGYVHRNGSLVGQYEDMSPSGPAGALRATVDDIGRFMMAHLEGGALGGASILSEETIRRMHRRSAQSSPHVDGMALGFMDVEVNGRRMLRHDGSTRFTHSELLLIPASRVGLFVTYNSHEGGYARRELRRAFVDRYFPADIPPTSAATRFPRTAADFAGSYQGLRRSFSTFEKLFGALPIAVKALPGGKLLIAADQWTQIAPDTFRNAAGERIAFGHEPGGGVTLSFKSSLAPARKIHWYQNPRYHALLLLPIVIAAAFAIAAPLRRRARDESTNAASVAWTRRIMAAIGALNISALILLASTFAGGIGSIMASGIPMRLRIGLALGVTSAVLTVAALIVVVLALAGRNRPASIGIGQLVHLACALTFVGLLHYWNLLGFHLG